MVFASRSQTLTRTMNGEFANQHLLTYCQRERITLTRSRPYRKTDSCQVGQKGWLVARRLMEHERYTLRAALESMNRVYHVLRLYVNSFRLTTKLQNKTRHGSEVRKVYS